MEWVLNGMTLIIAAGRSLARAGSHLGRYCHIQQQSQLRCCEIVVNDKGMHSILPVTWRDDRDMCKAVDKMSIMRYTCTLVDLMYRVHSHSKNHLMSTQVTGASTTLSLGGMRISRSDFDASAALTGVSPSSPTHALAPKAPYFSSAMRYIIADTF